VHHRKALSCSLGGKELFSGTRADERASCREIESVHRKPEHDRWVRVPNVCKLLMHIDRRELYREGYVPPENGSTIVRYAYPEARVHYREVLSCSLGGKRAVF
jgi:hypothetical protein